MRLKTLEISGFKSFAKKATLSFDVPVAAIVGPNGSGKSNVAEAFRFVLGEQSVKSLRGKKGEDLIFGGGKTLARLNRASVKVVFDNANRRLPIDFDEVTLERVVHRDGFNDYFINGSQVRLKDIAELLAHANIGSTGHHIISQGEADRILSASPVERREMVEDALGLKIYHYRKKESLRKLQKTIENMKQVESLRREVAPHLSFLRKQVEKLEKGRELKEKLRDLYLEYFYRESIYIAFTKKVLLEEKREPEQILRETEQVLQHAQKEVLVEDDPQKVAALAQAKEKLSSIEEQKNNVVRDLGRIEGELAFIVRMSAKNKVETNKTHTGHPHAIAWTDFEKITETIQTSLREALQKTNLEEAFDCIKKADESLSEFFKKLSNPESSNASHEKNSESVHEYAADLARLESEKETLGAKIISLSSDAEKYKTEIADIIAALEAKKQHSREAERNLYEAKARQNEAISALTQVRLREETLEAIEAEFKREQAEAGALIGQAILGYPEFKIVGESAEVLSEDMIASEARAMQDDRKRTLQRMKIRVEDAGLGTGEEVLKEYKETSERDEFLKKEIEDLQTASTSLSSLIAELDAELKKRFDEGLIKINDGFDGFFKTMFGGGEARLDISLVEKKAGRSSETEGTDADFAAADNESESDEDEGTQAVGLDVHVALPHKRIKGLVMLSGGERALTSIALLFAISKVNPPPFVILDETDAALDEANSRKYGDMIESLAKHSQLILITHNRETMSRAGILYGVTMSAEGYSTLLSIRFEEALKVAK